MADPILPVFDPDNFTTHVNRLIWLLHLLADDTAVRFTLAKERREEFALLDVARFLHDAARQIDHRHEQFLQGNGQ